jgi:hypothetical protein
MEPAATYTPQHQPLRSTDEHHSLMQLLWQRMRQAFGVEAWESKHGTESGATFAEWSRTLQQYTRDQVARGVGHCQEWQGAGLPTLADFCRLCLTDLRTSSTPAAAPPPARPAPPARDTSVRDREMRRQQQIATSPKSRQPSAGDVESFMQAYHNCGLGRRWPSGHPAI